MFSLFIPHLIPTEQCPLVIMLPLMIPPLTGKLITLPFFTRQVFLMKQAVFDKAYEDVKAAFEYYLQHYNNGRPIIIASHSQGTTHAKRLIKEFFDGQVLQNKLVVAYLVGMPVEPGYFTSIPVCSTPYQTGCICSWRTFRAGYEHPFVQKEKFTAVVTNPLTWDSSKSKASRYENKGAVLYKFNKVLSHVAGAQLHEGVLWTE